MKLDIAGFERFNELNPDIDILTFDFLHPDNKGRVNWDGSDKEATVEKLMRYQRLLRVIPEPALASKLIEQGMTSAQAIAAHPEEQFVEQMRAAFEDDEELLRGIHRKAVQTKLRVQQLYANFKDTVGSPFYKKSLFSNISQSVEDYLRGIPSYQDFFGSLTYCACEECRSIFGPAAYFVDIMRVTEKYITKPNPGIPDGFKLRERRPDLWERMLTCENTNDLVPYLQVVNELLENRIGGDALFKAATSHYPFNLPFNYPLTQTRRYLNEMKSAVWMVYQTFLPPAGSTTTDDLPTPFETAREHLGLTPEQYTIVSTANTDPASLASYYKVPEKRLLPFQASGRVSIKPDTAVTGVSTKFGSEIEEGDFVQVGNVSRVVKSIQSDLLLTVDVAWTSTVDDTTMMVYPYNSLSEIESFLYHTSLSYGELKELLFQGLDSEEIKAGIPSQFFINRADPSAPFLTLSIDSTDPDAPAERIANETYKNLDRLNRFIRMSKITGVNFADLDWAFQGRSDIDEQLTQDLSDIKQVSEQFRIGIDEVTALYSDIKTIGVLDPRNPMDLFDRLFNKPSMLQQGLEVYHPLYSGNPLYKGDVIDLIVNGAATTDPIRDRLLAAFGLVDNDLTSIAQRALKVLSISDGLLPLTVENLSLLYSYARMPSLLGLTVTQYLVLLDLAGMQRLDSIADVKSIVELGRWIVRSRLNIFALEYVITGRTSQYYRVGYDGSQLYTFLHTLWALAPTWLLNPSSFVYENITPEESSKYLKSLQEKHFVSAHGVVLDKEIDFSSISFLDPIFPDSFITPMITSQESADSFVSLCDHEVLILQGNTQPPTAYLSPSFNSDTDLSYLFPNDPLEVRKMKIGEVREILLYFKREIQYVLDTLIAFGRAQDRSGQEPPRGLQEQNLANQLGLFFGASTEGMLRLARFAAAETGMLDYVAQFLQPPPPTPGQISPQIDTFMKVVSRCLIVAGQLNLTPVEITAIATHPEYFNITTLAQLTLDDIHHLYTFKELQRAFKDPDDELIDFFSTPLEGACSDSKKFQELANLTRWNIEQICQLVAALWGTSASYNSVLGVQAMKKCFDLASLLGVDINALLGLVQLAGFTEVDQKTWQDYNTAAGSWLNILHAKYEAGQWPSVYDTITDSLNENKRDALNGLAISTLQDDDIDVETSDDLYNYLLIDIEMSGCARTSYIRQALSSVQLYMQRCRLNLEPGVETMLVPEVWWDWLSSYRIWEANRKVFLYPENYIDPTLRKDKTALYTELQDSLLSSDITEGRVYDAYVQYFDQLTALSAVENVASYYCPVTDPNTGLTYNTLYFFARTPVKPYAYYYRSFANNIWSEWKKINLTIKSSHITPVYLFDRLFIFWPEMDTTAFSNVTNSNSNEYLDTRTSIKFSFYNFSKQWVQPQTAWEVITDFTPCSYSTPLINPNSFDLSQIMFNQPILIQMPSARPSDARILLLYGYYYKLSGGTPPQPPDYFVNNDEKDLVAQVYKSTVRAMKSSNQGLAGMTFLNSGVVIDSDLNASLTNVNLLDYTTIMDAPQPYALMLTAPDSGPATLDAYLVDNIFLQLLAGRAASRDGFGITRQSAREESLVAVDDPTSLPLLYNISKSNAYQFNVANQPGWFTFNNGDETFLIQSQEPGLKMLSDITLVKSNLSGQSDETDLMNRPYTANPQPFADIKYKFVRLTSGAITRLSQNLFTGGVSSLLSVESQETPADPLYPFSRFYQAGSPPSNTIPPTLADGDTIDYDGPYGTYFWEVFYYIPFMIGNYLMANQQYSEAKMWYEYIFNPTATYDPALGNDSYWEFLKLRGITVESLQEILTNPQQIAVYNNDPFDPNAIARLRPSAFQKAIVMRYIDNIIKWADFLYTKDTWESIDQATLLYILARDLLGPRPVQTGVCSQEPPATFAEIEAKYGDNIPQFLINLENALPPVSNGAPGLSDSSATGASNGYVPFNDLNSYFCVGPNYQLMAYWDLIEDRLYKIRHCMNIQGTVRQLALFEPPIDPMALVRAAAAGRDILSVADQWQPTSSPYRFVFLLNQAKGFAGQLVQLGGQLLSTLERKDAEELALLRQTQEIEILNLTTRVREGQIEQLDYTIESLDYSRQSAVARNRFYQNLINAGLLPSEQLNISSMILSNVFNMGGSLMRGLSSAAYLVPNVGSPFAMTYGGNQIGSSLAAAAAVFDMFSAYFNMISSLSLTMAGYERRAQEWNLQQETSAQDIEQIQAQIEATKTQREIAVRELQIHLKLMEQSQETEDFLRSRFTNVELYQWMVNRISIVYFQTYRLAVETGLAAEMAFQYEMNSNKTFITLNYWDSVKKGLLAGEQLLLNLNQLEQAYTLQNVRTLEIQKTISLLQINPKALLKLKETGKCEFDLSEALFDYDYPGQYSRKIKSVSITIPALVGPYQNVKATLTQTGSQILIEPNPDGVAFLLGASGSTTPPGGSLRSNWHANQRIAVSRGIDDSGMFQLNFNDDRYLPFEGTGAVSRWEFSMPKQTNRFDFNNISDVVIKLSYTALMGDEDFKDDVIELLEQQPYVGYVAFNFAAQFPSEWYSFMNPPAGADSQQFSLEMLPSYFPYGMEIEKVSNVYLQLGLAPEVQLGGSLSASLQIGAQTPIAVVFNNSITCNLADLNIQDALNKPWSVTVNKSGIPANLQDPKTGLLDSSKLLSIGMIITYEGSLNWE